MQIFCFVLFSKITCFSCAYCKKILYCSYTLHLYNKCPPPLHFFETKLLINLQKSQHMSTRRLLVMICNNKTKFLCLFYSIFCIKIHFLWLFLKPKLYLYISIYYQKYGILCVKKIGCFAIDPSFCNVITGKGTIP